MVRKEGNQYVVRSEEGKSLGKYKSKGEAVKRLRQVEWFKAHPTKHQKKERYKLECTLPNLNGGDYVCEENVPIFNNGNLKDGEEGFKPEAELQEIVDNTNARQKTCDLPIIAIGHKQNPGDGEPPICGYCKNFRLADFNSQPTIVADLYFQKDKAAAGKEYPRRSAEIWEQDNYIDRVALLGSTTPARDLALTYSKQDELKRFGKGNKQQECPQEAHQPGPCSGNTPQAAPQGNAEPQSAPSPERKTGLAGKALKQIKHHTIGEAKHWLKVLGHGYKKNGLRGVAKVAAVKSYKKTKQTYVGLEKRYGRPAAIAMFSTWLGINAAAVLVTPKVWAVMPEPLGMIVGVAEGLKYAWKGGKAVKRLTGFAKPEPFTPEVLVNFLLGFNQQLGLPPTPKEKIIEATKKLFGQPAKYMKPEKGELMDETKIAEAVLKALESTGLFEVLKKLSGEEKAVEEDLGGGEEFDMGGDMEGGEEMPADMPAESEAPAEDLPEDDKEEYQASKRKLARYSKQIEAQDKRIKELERREVRAVRKTDLMQLEQEGYQFDFATELSEVETLEPAKYSKHLERIKRNYQKAPVDSQTIPVQQGASKETFSYDDSLKAADLIKSGAAKNGQDAFNILRGVK